MVDNFAWICTWKITHRCNLSCTYCDHAVMLPAGAKERIDHDAIVRNLQKLSPKIVNISGGEPTLVDALPRIVRELKQRFNPFVRVVHNGTQPRRAVPLFPHIDRFVVSIDGPGDLNRATRGIEGDLVIEKFGGVVGDAEAENVELAVNCVVTARNVTRIRELAEKLRAASPAIVLSLTPVMPPDGPESILSDPATYARFEAEYRDMKRDGLRVIHTFDQLRRHETFSCIQCYNQFFIIRVSPEGRVSACPMNVPLGLAGAKVPVRALLSGRGLKKAARAGMKALRARSSNTVDFSCSTICNCEGWLDMLFAGEQSESAPVYLRGLHGRLDEKDYARLDDFVRKHINPSFDVRSFRKLVEEAV
jgi:MoaA/NifB/PqqE/SkfB family radical SAM enzyme